MIQLQNIQFSIGQRTLFESVDWVIAPGSRYALVGPNGTGKTTLIKVALGEITPERGVRILSRGSRVGYLPQEAAERFDGTVLDRALEAHRYVRTMREELDTLHQALRGIAPDDPHLKTMLERAGELQHRLDLHDEHRLEPEARRMLSGLGFARADQDRPLAKFSGGWRMRAALCELLLIDPTLLFLDEPTNHLDLPAMEWLEDYLEDFHGGLVVVSHDRVFLDRVTSQVCELEHGRLTAYPMTFTRYLEEKEVRRDQMEAQNVQLEQKIAQLSRFVERFRAKNTKASQAQSKKKQIERLKSQRVVIPRHAKGIHFRFPDPPHAGRSLVRLKEVSFGYAARDVFTGATVEIERGVKIAIVGANGAGKTTLLRVLGGQLTPRTGEREEFSHTRTAYFAQHAAETLDAGLTVLGAVEEVANAEWHSRLRSLLGSFLFSGDDVFKLCRVLSGGERQRVALVRILLEPANLLLLDEPTHHLDLAGKEVLEDALDQYPGAVVVVTHDRSLMARLATQVIEVNDGRVTLYPGGYDDYESTRLRREKEVNLPYCSEVDSPMPKPRRKPVSEARETSAARTDNRREQELARIEKAIESHEARRAVLEQQLANPEVYHDGSRAKELVGEYKHLCAELESLWQRFSEF